MKATPCNTNRNQSQQASRVGMTVRTGNNCDEGHGHAERVTGVASHFCRTTGEGTMAMTAQARLDALTQTHTAFRSFHEMVARGVIDNYSPTLRKVNQEVAELADAFDREMVRWGSHVRAWRGLT